MVSTGWLASGRTMETKRQKSLVMVSWEVLIYLAKDCEHLHLMSSSNVIINQLGSSS